MQKTRFSKTLLLILCIVLTVAIALTASGCNNAQTTPVETTLSQEATVMGEGETQFTFTVIDPDQKQTTYQIHTDEETVGEALSELKLIEGEEGPYGLEVKTVLGITVDYNTDKKYWAFYENGTYANQGVDSTPIQQGGTYSFKVEQ